MPEPVQNAEWPSGGKRFFISLAVLPESFPSMVTITDEFTVHHLRTVMRARCQEAVTLVDAQREVAYGAVIVDLQKHTATFSIQRRLEAPSNPLPQVVLAIALIKEQRWDWLLQKATELGVRTFQPLLAERSVIRLTASDIPKKLERWQAVVRSASEQSEGLFIPTLLPPLSISAYLKEPLPGVVNQNPLKLILRERGENRQSLKQQLAGIQLQQTVVLSIGPEGGWTDAELGVFEQAGFIPVSLGERILRSETAAIAAMSAITYESGASGGIPKGTKRQ